MFFQYSSERCVVNMSQLELSPYDLTLTSIIMDEYEDVLETLEVHNFYRNNPTYVPRFEDMSNLFPDSSVTEVVGIVHRVMSKYHIHFRGPITHYNVPVKEVW